MKRCMNLRTCIYVSKARSTSANYRQTKFYNKFDRQICGKHTLSPHGISF